mgnify:CR=1 FL=1
MGRIGKRLKRKFIGGLGNSLNSASLAFGVTVRSFQLLAPAASRRDESRHDVGTPSSSRFREPPQSRLAEFLVLDPGPPEIFWVGVEGKEKPRRVRMSVFCVIIRELFW